MIESREQGQVSFTDLDEVLVYARCLKKEGVTVDGEYALVNQNSIAICYHCSIKSSLAHARKTGLFCSQTYYCTDCRGYVGKCFICQQFFESESDLSRTNHTQISCKDCSTNK